MAYSFNPENAPVTGTSPQVKAILQSIKDKKFCKIHMFYENKINLDDLKWCDKHTKGPLIDNKCIYCDKINTKKS